MDVLERSLAGPGIAPMAGARREVGLEIRGLAEDFERSDEAAFHRARVACWAVTAAVAVIGLILLILGGDWRYLTLSWAALVGLAWAGHALSSRRQRRQTGRLRALATRWLDGSGQPAAAG